MAFAFSSILYPLPQQRALRQHLPPKRRGIGLTLFRLNDTSDVVLASTPAAFMSVCPKQALEHPAACLLARACQRLWLFGSDGAFGGSLVLDLSLSLALPPPCAGSEGERLTAFLFVKIQEVRCLDSFRPSRYQLRRCR